MWERLWRELMPKSGHFAKLTPFPFFPQLLTPRNQTNKLCSPPNQTPSPLLYSAPFNHPSPSHSLHRPLLLLPLSFAHWEKKILQQAPVVLAVSHQGPETNRFSFPPGTQGAALFPGSREELSTPSRLRQWMEEVSIP